MGKWELLKKALNGKKDLNDPESIHRHHGYKVIFKKPIVWIWNIYYHIDYNTTWEHFLSICQQHIHLKDTTQLLINLTSDSECYEMAMKFIDDFVELNLGRVKSMCTNCSKTIEAELYFFNKEYQPKLSVCKYYQYNLPIIREEDPIKSVYTREHPPDEGIKFADLFSHRLHGVDNTGNVKVWEAESVLAYILLTQPEYYQDFNDKRILEIGGGSTGLCGLCLASSPHHLCREIVITDGHPDCVFNQNICLQMCQQSKSILPNTNVSCHRLLWQQNDPNNELHSLLYPSHSSSTSPSLFDCIIAADCMFFKDFHSDLLWILNSALSDNGVVYMLQPKRGDTMDRFLSLAQSFFHISVVENYSSKITELHEQYLQDSTSGYDPDIHYPLLVVLHKLPSSSRRDDNGVEIPTDTTTIVLHDTPQL